MFMRSLAIAPGEVFQKKKFSDKKKSFMMNKTSIDKIIKNQVYDEAEFKYADFNSLLIMDYVSLYNLEHLRFIPYEILKGNLFSFIYFFLKKF